MHQSKLIQALRKLDSRQLSRFEDFLLSPYFNKNEENVLFFKYLRKFAPGYEDKKLQKEYFIEKVKLPFILDDKSLGYLMNRLLKLFEEFLAVEKLKENDLMGELYLLDQYYSLNMSRHEKTVENRIEKKLENYPYQNALFYQHQFLYKYLQYEHADPNLRSYDPKLQNAVDALDAYYIIEKLRYSCQMLNLSKTLELDYKISIADKVAEWANSKNLENDRAIKVYATLYQLLSDDEGQLLYEKTKSLLVEQRAIFNKADLKQLYTFLLNHCARQINRSNDNKYWQEYLGINKLLLNEGLLLENGELPPWRYSNLVTVGLRIGEVDWTKDFIEKYRDKLPQEYIENLYHYNKAQLYYYLKDFNKAQSELIHVVFNDVLLNISARSLLIKIYFETNQEELLLSYLEATRVFLIRNKVLDEKVKSQMKKFVELCAKMVKSEYDKEKLLELLEQLPPTQEVLHRDWLVKQLKQQLSH